MLKIRGPVVSKDLFWCLQFSLQDELHTGLIKAGASVGCDNHVLYVKLMTLLEIRHFTRVACFFNALNDSGCRQDRPERRCSV